MTREQKEKVNQLNDFTFDDIYYNAFEDSWWFNIYYILTHNDINTLKVDLKDSSDQLLVNTIIKYIIVWYHFGMKFCSTDINSRAQQLYNHSIIEFMLAKLYRNISKFAKIDLAFNHKSSVTYVRVKMGNLKVHYMYTRCKFTIIDSFQFESVLPSSRRVFDNGWIRFLPLKSNGEK